jgi:hypothetical protein
MQNFCATIGIIEQNLHKLIATFLAKTFAIAWVNLAKHKADILQKKVTYASKS